MSVHSVHNPQTGCLWLIKKLSCVSKQTEVGRAATIDVQYRHSSNMHCYTFTCVYAHVSMSQKLVADKIS